MAERDAYEATLDGQDPYSFGPRVRDRYLALKAAADLAEVGVKTAQIQYTLGVKAYEAEIQPYLTLEALARKTYADLSKPTGEGGAEINRLRALRAIELDLPKLYPPGLAKMGDARKDIETLIKAGRPISEVREFIGSRYGQDLAARNLIESFFDTLEFPVDDVPGGELLAKIAPQLDYLTKLSNVLSVTSPATTDPLRSSKLEGLATFVDLAGEFIPTSPTSVQLQFHKQLLEGVQASLSLLQFEGIKQNLILLEFHGNKRTEEYGDDWLKLEPELLFGIPGPHPVITPTKTSFRVGEPITGEFYASWRYADSAWLGIVPSSTEHGPETVGDASDLDYIRVGRKYPGRFNFTTRLDPGDYDLRMYDDDAGGSEVYSVGIKVSTVGVDLTGNWVGTNYFCTDGGGSRAERVKIVQSGDQVTATKTTGDRCVPAGNETFSGSVSGRVSCVLGSPENPAGQRREDSLTITNEERFTACGVFFERE